MDITILENTANIKTKEKFQKDYYLNKLIDYTIQYSKSPGVNTFINVMFYVKKIKDYDNQFYMFNMTYPESIEEINQIYILFNNWKPFELYNLGELRGNFLELLSYKLINNEFEGYDIYRESKIKIQDYISHTWDIIIENHIMYLFECKFSQESIKRNHLDQMVGLMNKLDDMRYSTFLVFYSPSEKVYNRLKNLQLNTKTEKFEEIMNKFNIITLNEFNKGNPFKQI